ncbi:MAG TPA: hypothetical protein VLD62_12615 [Acidimicrobiia bacterium]|nr:hypothetical protein [Acidimicrobiia bacterium]
MMLRRLGIVAALAAALVVLTAGPVLADPVAPTNYRSVVNTVDPLPTGVTISVLGGDGYLAMVVTDGHTAEVPGYFGEPYLRFDGDGSVWRNALSPARFINRDRYGTTGVPDSADAAAEPRWEQVASGGSFAWHDHRTHWMSTDLPPTIGGDRAEIVFPWFVDIVVDGVETEVRGELLWFPSVNPIGPLLSGGIAVLLFLAWRRGRLSPLPHIAAGAGALVLFVAITQFAATPGSDRGLPIGAVAPAIAILLAVGALWIGRVDLPTRTLVLVSGLALIWWAFDTRDALTAPVLPSALPTFVERASVALALWLGAGLVVLTILELLPRRTVDGEPTDADRVHADA